MNQQKRQRHIKWGARCIAHALSNTSRRKKPARPNNKKQRKTKYQNPPLLPSKRQSYQRHSLRSLSSESSSELEVLGLDGDSLRVDSGQVGWESVNYPRFTTLSLTVFEERNEISLGSFLEGENSARLKSNYYVSSDYVSRASEGIGDTHDQS